MLGGQGERLNEIALGVASANGLVCQLHGPVQLGRRLDLGLLVLRQGEQRDEGRRRVPQADPAQACPSRAVSSRTSRPACGPGRRESGCRRPPVADVPRGLLVSLAGLGEMSERLVPAAQGVAALAGPGGNRVLGVAETFDARVSDDFKLPWALACASRTALRSASTAPPAGVVFGNTCDPSSSRARAWSNLPCAANRRASGT